MRKALGFLLLCIVVCSSFSAEVVCDEPSVTKTIFLSEKLEYEVAGKGRLYFHTAPNIKCKRKNIFVMPGDSLVAHEECGDKSEWTFVSYISKSGKNYEGWVITNRLKFTGAMSADGIEGKKMDFYKKAAKDAASGKLGSPWTN